MRFIREERLVPLVRGGARELDGVVRVRGLEAERSWRTAPASGHDETRIERHEPVAVIVREDGGERRIAMPQPAQPPPLIAYAAGPVLALIAARLLKKGR
jgi:hypothetical protein